MSQSNLSLTRAVADGDTEAVRALLAEGADANGTTSGGQTPLVLAILFRHVHILGLLLAAGADPQRRDSLGLNAIDWAERKGFTEGVKLLLHSQSPPSTHNTEPTVPDQSVSRSVEKKNTPTAKPSEKLPRSEEKTRQWLAGIKRRFDEEAVRKVKEVQPAPLPSEKDASPAVEPPRAPVNDNTFQQSITLPESPVMPDTGIIARPPDLPTNVAVDTPQPKAEIISQETSSAKAMTFAADSEKKPQRPPSTIDPWPTSSPRKRCPKCNAIYNSELVAYCAVDMTPLVPADQPVVISPPVTATMPLVWILVVSAFIASAGITYLITGYLSKVEKVSAPTTAPPPQAAAVKSDMPVVSGELAGKALTLPEPDYPPTAKTEGVRGTILVRITVDKNGRVISARSSAGDPRLRAAAVKAATKATFSAEKLSGREASGTIVYTFKP